jgi:hypothetical protein
MSDGDTDISKSVDGFLTAGIIESLATDTSTDGAHEIRTAVKSKWKQSVN